MRRIQAEEFLAGSRNALLLDVRSPGEYNHAHIPGAVSFPLFSDEERKAVGTTYKQTSREAAIKIGLDFFGPKMRGMVEQVEELVSNKQYAVSSNETTAANRQPLTAYSIFIYCWRGGMRSGAVAWLLNLYGFNLTVLAGGYKAFRNLVLRSFEQPYPLKIIGGYTGSGKTEVLQQLKANGETIVDLEGLASHKGSAFGNINMPPQPSQEMFENLLSLELLTANCKKTLNAKTDEHEDITSTLNPQASNFSIWLEDESQRIGTVNIPGAFWKTMRTAPVYFLDVPFKERLTHILEEYGNCEKEKLFAAIERIKKRLGGLEAKSAMQFLEEDKLEECFAILLRYYDKYYDKGLHNRENLSSLLKNVSCKTFTPQNAAALLNTHYAE